MASKAGKRIIRAAKEAIAIARGEMEPAAVHHLHVRPGDHVVVRHPSSGEPVELRVVETIEVEGE